MRTIIAGSRNISDPATVERAVRECGWWPSVILSGKARGVDSLGERWAAAYGVPVSAFPADWEHLGKAAGHVRNAEMARDCDALIAVWDGTSPGTRNMIETAQAMGRRVHVHRVDPATAWVPDFRSLIPPPPATVPLCAIARETGKVPIECAFACQRTPNCRENPPHLSCEHGNGVCRASGTCVLGQCPPAAALAPPSSYLPAAVLPPPPALSALLAGAQLVAGLTWSTVLPELDFETSSQAGYFWLPETRKWAGPPNASQGKKGLPVIGAAVYSMHPSTQVDLMAYDLKDGKGRRRWRKGMPIPDDLAAHVRAGGLLSAWNAGFERWMWENVCVARLGWPAMRPEQWRCDMAKARSHALPGKLAEAGKVLNLDVQKDGDGKRLMDRFSMPRNPTIADPRVVSPLLWTPAEAEAHWHSLHPESMKPAAQRKSWEMVWKDHLDSLKYADYNETDIETEAEASSILPDLSPDELRYWQDDQAINHRGVQIDMESVHNCVAIIEQAQQRYGDEMRTLTGGIEPTELAKLKGWLHAYGVHLDSMDEDAIDEALLKPMPPHCKRALEIRAAVGSASVKKVFAMRNSTTPSGRLHDTYVYHGARTGRPTGAGVQSTNLPKAGPNVYRCGFGQDSKPLASGGCGRYHGAHTMTCHWCNRTTIRPPQSSSEWNPEAMVDAIEAIGHRSLDWLEVLFGDAMLTLAGVLRGLFIAAPGHDFISSDFTAIEGVVIAALAGEQWRLDVYAGHGQIYLESASRAFGVPLAELLKYKADTGMHHPLRDKGKRMELGLGFGGWIGALRSPQINYVGPDEELKAAILKWRGASPALEWLWGGQKKGKADSILQNAGRMQNADQWDRTPLYFGLEGMAVSAVMNPGTEYPVMRLNGTHTGISYLMRGDVLYCRVPSGGIITYHRPRLQPAEQEWRGLALSYEGWNTNAKKGATGWMRMPLYAGLAAENVTQKTARDKQMGAIRRLHGHSYPVVMHTYDENVAEVPKGFGSVEELEGFMTTPEPWNEGWPIKAAGGWRATRYRKG